MFAPEATTEIAAVESAPPLIAHIDMDAFFVSVELLRRPQLRGKPVVVGGSGPRAVVAAASYAAREFGVRSATAMAKARELCPGAVILAPDMAAYRAASTRVMAVLAEFSETVEVLGLDEAYLDLGDCPTPKSRARAIKHAIRSQTGLVCSVGIGPNRLIAKIASDLDKPDGLCLLVKERFLDAVGERPARLLPGIGPKTAERIGAIGITTVAELAAVEFEALAAIVGHSQAEALRARARGEGSAELCIARKRKSESRVRTFDHDLTDPAVMHRELTSMAERLAADLLENDRRGRTVTLKIRLRPFRTFSRSRTLATATNDRATITAAALALFDEFERDAPVRLLGVGLAGLEVEDENGPAPEAAASGKPGTRPIQLTLVDLDGEGRDCTTSN